MSIAGRWRITEMELWDQEAMDLVEPAFIEFGEQGSYQDTSQLKNAIELVQNTSKPLVITYVHGWQNNAESGDVESFSGLLSRLNRAPAR